MPSYELEESNYAGPIEKDEVFEAEVTRIKEVKEPYQDKQTGADVYKVEFQFVIQDEGPHDGSTLYGKTGTKFNTHPDCKLRNWSAAILNSELPTGYVLDTDTLIGQRCRVIIGAREYQDKKTGEDKIYNFVDDVMPARDAIPAGDDTF